MEEKNHAPGDVGGEKIRMQLERWKEEKEIYEWIEEERNSWEEKIVRIKLTKLFFCFKAQNIFNEEF